MIIVVPRKVALQSTRTLQLGNILLVPIDILERPLARVASFMTRLVRTMPKILSNFQIELVHFTFDYPTFTMNLGFDKPVVSTLHHLHYVEALNSIHFNHNLVSLVPYMTKQMLLTYSERMLMNQSAAIIAVSRFTKESAVRYLGFNPARITVVQNGIPIEPLSDFREGNVDLVFRNLFSFLGNDKLILYVGRLERSKGLEYLIEAFSRIMDKIPSVKLVVIGSGDSSYVNRLKRKIALMHIEENVFFLGRVTQQVLTAAYGASSVVVLPSLMEGFGLTLTEAMVRGKPVVATKVGAIPEIVQDGITGLLAEPADATSLSELILRVLTDSELARKLAQSGNEQVKKHNSLSEMCRLTERVYLELQNNSN